MFIKRDFMTHGAAMLSGKSQKGRGGGERYHTAVKIRAADAEAKIKILVSNPAIPAAGLQRPSSFLQGKKNPPCLQNAVIGRCSWSDLDTPNTPSFQFQPTAVYRLPIGVGGGGAKTVKCVSRGAVKFDYFTTPPLFYHAGESMHSPFMKVYMIFSQA
jgi:hypothetical protein